MPTKVTAEDRFDFQAWITNARPAVKAVTVYNRPDLVERVNALTPAKREDGPRTYSSRKESPELTAARAEMEKSALTIVIKANNDEDDRTARAAEKQDGVKDNDQESHAVYLLAQTIVDVYPGPEREYDYDAPHTTFTVSQVKSLRTAIREAQFTRIWLTQMAVSNAAPEPSPDFSQPSLPDHGTPPQS